MLKRLFKAKTKQGAAAIYTVVFFCLLIGIVTVGFISIMIQDILSSTNYDLSQSAYDSALAGVEDAKVLLLQYNTCLSNDSRLSGNKCNTVISKINTAGSSDDCDLVRDTLGRASGNDSNNQETLIQSQNSSLGANNSKALDDQIDMAYTCVKLALASDDYLGTLTETSDVKMIPLRTGVGGAYNDAGGDGNFNRIRIQWYTNDNHSVATQQGGYSSATNGMFFSSSKTKMGDTMTTNAGWHNFNMSATLPPPIRVSLIQTDATFKMKDFDNSSNLRTDRGSLLLRPVFISGNPSATDSRYRNHIESNTSTGFYGSTLSNSEDYTNSSINATNSPMDVYCRNLSSATNSGYNYSCSAEIDVPSTLRGTTNNGTRFLMLSSLYAKPDTSFSVQLLNCDSRNNCGVVKFVGVQSKVDATGRANDLFRRIEARVELQDVNYPFVKYGLSVFGSGSGEGEIFKNYWATSNCWYKEKGENKTCSNYTRAGDTGNF